MYLQKYGCRTVSGIVFQVQNREGESLPKWEHRDHVEFLTDLKNAFKRIREQFTPDLLFSGGNLFMGLLGFTVSKSRIRGIQFVHWMGMFCLFMEKPVLSMNSDGFYSASFRALSLEFPVSPDARGLHCISMASINDDCDVEELMS